MPMALFAVQLAFNLAWSWLFFGMHSPGAACVDVVPPWTAIAATTIAFWRRSPVADVLFVPYLALIGFAAVLSFAV